MFDSYLLSLLNKPEIEFHLPALQFQLFCEQVKLSLCQKLYVN